MNASANFVQIFFSVLKITYNAMVQTF